MWVSSLLPFLVIIILNTTLAQFFSELGADTPRQKLASQIRSRSKHIKTTLPKSRPDRIDKRRKEKDE